MIPPRRLVSRLGGGLAAVVLALTLAMPSAAETRAALEQSISPYLRLHAGDPVHWREWSPELLEEARHANRPLLISSGYYACHWCHVMQEESFQDEGIAERLNRDFIPVKIDRELHTALDHYLIEFLRATRGIAGWPLNVVVLPTGDAVAGVVYAPRDDFARFLDGISEQRRRDGEALAALARAARLELTERLRTGEEPLSATRAARLPQALWTAMEREADFLAGGFGDQSKFPRAPELQALLQAREEGRAPPWAGEFLEVTLDEMARAGLRDVLGGGFFRYSETPDWGRPHFEIMLEDQAQLARVYLRAAREFERDDWAAVGRDALEFVLRDMALDTPGAYASALSAIDEAGREGGAYLWTQEQVEAALAGHPEPGLVRAWFGLEGALQFDYGYLPLETGRLDAIAERFDLEPEAASALIEAGRRALRADREARGLPRDEKPLTGMHGLLLSAFAEVADDPELAPAGAALAARLQAAADDPEALSLMLDLPPEVAGAAGLSDYAYLAQGLHDWSVATGDGPDATVAVLLEAAWSRFRDADGWQALEERPLPGMVAQRFQPAVHRPSPTTRILALTQAYADQSAALAERLEASDLRPGQAVETTPQEHAGLILLVTGG
ncbi:thioredoxin domain-containing protein [Thioalkalivibrio sp.]|uniref:thioredoxin domain-containing protein n=1 Tax=Thioalkalivibrio sp. TaxID=2093813 RepID=UPI0035697668